MVVGRGKKGRGVASSRTTKAARKRVQGLWDVDATLNPLRNGRNVSQKGFRG